MGKLVYITDSRRIAERTSPRIKNHHDSDRLHRQNQVRTLIDDAFVANNLITLATTLIVGAITTYIVTSHATTASISSDRKTEDIDKKIEALDTTVSNLEKGVTMQKTDLRFLEECLTDQ